ncbi:28S ribosomal protein S35-like protein [Dinothrombium tinctorium]|uniref:28S ribosomal protein S35-like protein n=1 Tax=Dinothrombium tinctorium TaxID=1965070 RepID=A0A443R2R8_9ACAR|nr:28S ribosomal protein S35-like protein [Dinothrombium tinctorium]
MRPKNLFLCLRFQTISSRLFFEKRFYGIQKSSADEEEFDKLNIMPRMFVKGDREPLAKREALRPQLTPRYNRMPVDQDWNSVWPTAKMFNPSAVPLPVHMGKLKTVSGPKPPPGKFANPELMKVPNFLHLAPPAIKKHCDAIRKFCTPWPQALTDEMCDKYFPLEVITSDYCHASPTIREPKARIITIRIKLSSLDLDYHAKDKLKRILQHRYDPKTDLITIVADKCPLKSQNIDYAKYLLTACFFEAWKTESWESEKEQSDWETFFWEKSPSKASLINYFKKTFQNFNEENFLEKDTVKDYSKSVKNLFDKEENDELLEDYRKNVEKLLFDERL